MAKSEPATAVGRDPQRTEVGSVFVSNYPPYSAWREDRVDAVTRLLEQPPQPATDLGLYLHIPFCRKRCKFCYFKVYTDKNSSQVESYVETVIRELELYSRRPAIAGRPLQFVYFGGGTPSFISSRHLRQLVAGLRRALPWEAVREMTFECEPGTLTEAKLEAIREVGVTRLSLGVENFDDAILERNGRAHVSKEIYRVLPWIRAQGFEQLNVDLISGMVGESWDTWRVTVRKTVELDPDSVTIYQMELPYNTVYSQDVLEGGQVAVADWATKREWHDYAINELQAAGYEISSGYTMLKRGSGARFAYRDALWHGADLLGIGVSSFSHLGGVHFQNNPRWDEYLGLVGEGRLPILRAYEVDARERLTREMILQMKLGRLDAAYFRGKFGVEILETFRAAFDRLAARGMLELDGDAVRLTRPGLLRVDQLLPEFYDPRFQNARYT